MADIQEAEVGPSGDDMRNLWQMIKKCLDEREELMNKGFDRMNKHFDGLNKGLDELNTKLDEQNNKFDELKIYINAGSDSCESNFQELERNIDKMKEWGTDIGKCNITENNEVTDDNGVNTGENNDGNKMTKNNGDISDNSNGVSLNAKQVAVDKVSNNDNSNNELTNNSDKVGAVSYTHLVFLNM